MISAIVAPMQVYAAQDPSQFDQIVEFNIPLLRADKALILFAEQADITLIFPFEETSEMMASQLVGKYKVTDALSILLAGRPLKLSMNNGRISVLSDTGDREKHMKKSLFGRMLAAITAGFLTTGIAVADDDSSSVQAPRTIEEVVVTATRRAASIQDVPISITALTDEDIEATGAQSLQDLADSVTNMIYPDSAYAGGADISIRGIFSRVDPFQVGFDSGFSVYLDGAYLGRSFSNNTDLGEIERVEVLKGPQGTLFGKNTIAGAISVVSKKPDANNFGASVKVDAGNYGLARLRGSVNVPMIEDTLAARLSIQTTKRDGYVKNLTIPGDDRGNQDIDSGRLQIGYTPSEDTDIYLNIDVLDSKYNPMGGYGIEFTEVTPIGARTDVFVEGVDYDNVPFTTFRDIREPVVQKNRGVSLSIEHRLKNDFTLASITGWRDDTLETVQDIDAVPYDGYHMLRRDNKQEMLTQEFRVSSPAYDRFDFVAGLYMLKQDNLYSPLGRIGEWWFGPGLAGVLADIENEVNVKSYAAFFHGNIRLTDYLTLFGGGRYTAETKKQNLISNFVRNADGTPSAGLCTAFGYECGTNVRAPVDIDDKEPSWTIGLRYTASPDFMTYGSIARGFKSSAFNYSNNQQKDFDNNVLMATPEFVTSYEVGFKSDWLENRLRVNASFFYLDYEDLQVKSFCPSCGLLGAGANIFGNAAAVTSQGFELEVRSQLTESLSAGLGIGYVDSKFDDFKGLALPRGAGAPGDEKDANPMDGLTDASGNQVPLAPKWTANATLEHVHSLALGGNVVSRLDYNFIDERYGAEGASNTADYLLPAYGTLKMRFGYEAANERWSVFLWAKNLTDEVEPEEARFSAFISNRYGYRYIEPRTYGVSFTYGF